MNEKFMCILKSHLKDVVNIVDFISVPIFGNKGLEGEKENEMKETK